jgi:leader peptidase (prepilin peptidase) / N-methyltransferase
MSALGDAKHRLISANRPDWRWIAGFLFLYSVPALVTWRGDWPSIQVLGASLVLAAALIGLSEFDRRTFRLPDFITISLTIAGLAATSLLGGAVVWHFLSAAFAFLVILSINIAYRKWRGVDGIGLGDAKLFAASGAWLGGAALPTVLIWACLMALTVLLAFRGCGHQVRSQDQVPFGIFLGFGTWLVWCFGPLQW